MGLRRSLTYEPVDLLADYLDGPRARGAFLLHVLMQPPWSMEVTDDAPLTLVAVLSGDLWLRRDGEEPRSLAGGDVLLVRPGTSYVLSSDRDLAPHIHIGPAQTCTGNDGRDLSDEFATGLRQWGNDPHGGDTLLVASYHSRAEVGRELMGALPELLVTSAASQPFLDGLVREVGQDDLAGRSMLDRLLDIVVVSAVREWSRRMPQSEQTWVAAGRDHVVHDAVTLIHRNPERAWTVDALARAVGVSRPALARRFQATLGVGPIGYLNDWRLILGADLLTDEQLTLSAVARRVGYATPFSFSTAFKRKYGASPSDYRAGRPTH